MNRKIEYVELHEERLGRILLSTMARRMKNRGMNERDAHRLAKQACGRACEAIELLRQPAMNEAVNTASRGGSKLIVIEHVESMYAIAGVDLADEIVNRELAERN